MEDTSDRPFREAFEDLKNAKGTSYRQIALKTARHRDQGALSTGYISELVRGARQPNASNLEVLAAAAGVEPEYFLEYRQHLAAARVAEIVPDVDYEDLMRGLDQLGERLLLEAAAQRRDKRSGRAAEDDHARIEADR